MASRFASDDLISAFLAAVRSLLVGTRQLSEDNMQIGLRLSVEEPQDAIDGIRSDLAQLDDWEDRYRYIIELGRTLPPFPDALRSEANKVRGCTSQVWIVSSMN